MTEIPFPAIRPWLVKIGALRIRWYGIAFVLAFLAGYRILLRLAKAGFVPLDQRRAGDFLTWMVIGVIAGGRLGHILFYRTGPFRTWWEPFAVWEGGLSFHGGVLGVCAAIFLFAARHRIDGWRLGDAVVMCLPPGIFFVRCANFVNGELFGRVAGPGVPWAMRFPNDPVAQRLLDLPPGLGLNEREEAVLARMADGTWDRVRPHVPLRHPSQLYEALGEGLLVGLLLWLVYRATKARPLPSGVYGGIFLAAYACVRFVIEFFREPDAELGYRMLGLTRGQQLCLLMLGAGLAVCAWRSWAARRRDPRPDPA
jgi:phosphatidylglycerol:prolipoprotein diacylglycerol transferase